MPSPYSPDKRHLRATPALPCRRIGALPAVLVALTLAACGGGGGSGPAPAAPLDFLHVTTAENSTGAVSILDHPRLNGNPDMIVIVTPVANPGGGFPRSFPGGPLTTEFDLAVGMWTLVDLHNSSDIDYAYNVSIFEPGPTAFRHGTTVLTVTGNSTELTHPLLDGEPGARVLVTMHREIGTSDTETINRHHIGLWYQTLLDSWWVFNQDRAPMSVGVGFDVVIVPASTQAYDHVATPANAVPTRDSETQLGAPWLDGVPGAIVHVTPIWNTPGTLPIGVYLDGLPVLTYPDPAWAISANLIRPSPMPSGARFFVARLQR